MYTEINPAPVIEPLQTRSVDDVLGYITDEVAHRKARELLETVRTLGPAVSMDPVQGAVSIKLDGKVAAYLWVKRKWFVFGHQSSDGEWVNDNVEPGTDLAPIRERLEVALKKGA